MAPPRSWRPPWPHGRGACTLGRQARLARCLRDRRSIALFIAAAAAEIGGAYIVWIGIARERGVDGVRRLGLNDLHHAVLVGERPRPGRRSPHPPVCP
jgi:hypothetical protein